MSCVYCRTTLVGIRGAMRSAVVYDTLLFLFLIEMRPDVDIIDDTEGRKCVI